MLAASLALWFLWQRRMKAAAWTAIVPLAVISVWMAWLTSRLPAEGVGLWNFDLPARGLIEAASGWAGPGELLLIGAALVGLAMSVVTVVRSPSTMMRMLAAPWVAMALLSSEIVWREPNNAVRVMAPLITLGALGLIAARDRVQVPSTSRKNLPV